MRRPAGFLVLSLLIGWLALAAFANAVIMLTPAGRKLGFGAPALSLFALLYGTCAIIAAVGLWRVAGWSLYAYFAWVASALAFGVAFTLTMSGSGVLPPWPGPWWLSPALFLLFVAALLSLPVPYIRRHLPPRA
ncbi:MAG TPA: hypothetical protein VLK84_23920 [Longimicrobium sp.]|nr:hypothetical protein [Longimicrobium sp.]